MSEIPDAGLTLIDVAFRAYERYRYPDHYLAKRNGLWTPVSGAEVRRRAERLAAGLRGLGVGPGSRVALMAPTSLEWVTVDLATLLNAAVLVPIYPTLSGKQAAYILQDSGATVLIVSDGELLGRLEQAGVEGVRHRVTIERVVGETSMAELVERSGPPPERLPRPHDLATLIYTSGTTGEPKGVMLTHANIATDVVRASEALNVPKGIRTLSFLPLSHVFERMASYFFLESGQRIAFAELMDRVAENMREVKPATMTAVPRVLEKVAASLHARLAAKPAPLRAGAGWALEGAKRATERRLQGQRVSLGLAVRQRLADRFIFKELRQNLGGQLRYVVTGGAATPVPLQVLFEAAGVRIRPGYGLTETSPVIAVNSDRHNRPGSVGKPLEGVEVRIAPDGEIMVRGPIVMQGYWNNEKATREAFDEDGWLHTGDVGRLDEDGFLFVTDRKKEIIVTSGGKNIAPQPIEQALVADAFIEQAVLIGDGRPCLTALLVPAMRALESWSRERGFEVSERAALLAREDVRQLYRERIDQRTNHLSRFETIKAFALLERELSQEAGELTPTLKVKRRVVAERYRDLIDALYEIR